MSGYLGKGSVKVQWLSTRTGVTTPAVWLRKEGPEDLQKDGVAVRVQVVTAVTYAPIESGDTILEGSERWAVIAAGFVEHGALDSGLTTVTLEHLP